MDVLFIKYGTNGRISPIEYLSVTDWNTTIDNNLKSTFQCLNSIPYIKEKGGSVIINSSFNGNRTFSNIGFFCL
ncbi:hypothetical protein [Bacillus sp. ISL-46]|uniref:hypothetical protein n=1 Tax=Bacillus sp. ISL-46 TaxID=2819129 RepID=UPI001BE83795|nr:hypothetical protein [Bacillus sp. ISL-46]